MRHGISLLLSLVSLLLIGTNTGCFAVQKVDLIEGLDHYRQEAPLAEAPATRNQGVEIVLVASPEMGCFFQRVEAPEEKEQLGPLRCAAFPVPSVDAKQEIVARSKEADKTIGMGVHFLRFSETLERALHEQLSRHFSKVNVRLVPESTGVASDFELSVELVLYQALFRTGDKRSIVTLVTRDPRRPFDGDVVDRVGNSHLAWMIPVGVLTFPLGVAIGSAILSSKERKMVERNTARSLDQAAQQLTDHLLSLSAHLDHPERLRVALVLRSE